MRAPFWYGIADGLGQPHELTVGRTWSHGEPHGTTTVDPDPNEDYDYGANVGQNLMRLLSGVPS